MSPRMAEFLLRLIQSGFRVAYEDEDTVVPPPDNPNWDWIVRTANKNAVMPLLSRYILKVPGSAIPDQVRQQVNESCSKNAKRSLLLTGEMLRILHMLGEHDIPAIPFKGPLLAAQAYGDVSLRQFLDLDFLVRRRDVLEAKNLLLRQGYKPVLSLNRNQEKALLRTECEYVLKHESRPIPVELHWGITTRRLGFPLILEQVQDGLVTVDICGRQVRTARAEEMLFILCVHGSRHLWRRLLWICDIAALVNATPKMDWARVLAASESQGCRRMVLLGLMLAKDLMAANVPEELMNRCRDDVAVGKLAAQVKEDLFQKPDVTVPFSELCRFHLGMTDRWRDKVAYALDVAVTPRVEDCALISVPEGLYSLYYLLRPFRLIGQYGSEPLRRMFRPKTAEPSE